MQYLEKFGNTAKKKVTSTKPKLSVRENTLLSLSLSLSTDESKENYQILLSFKKKKEKEQNTENKNKKLQKPNFPQHRKCIEHRENLGENRNVSRRWKFRVKNASRQTRRMLIRVSKRDERGRRIAFPIERRLAAAMRAIIQ